jgi:hypothetical protein
VISLFGSFYLSNNGIFFVSMILQQAAFSSLYYGLNITDIALAFFSPWLAHEKRKIFQDQAPWRRKESYVFMYGYNYA